MTVERTNTLLSVKDVNLQFGTKRVLDNINFEVKDIVRSDVSQGQVISLIGRSGVGKTQLLRILCGLNSPTSGEVKIGLEQTLCKPGDMGLVPQDYFLYPWRKVKKILEMAAKKNPKFDNQIVKDAVNYYIAEFELTDHIDKYPLQLSGGQRQRVSISQQLLNGSQFLLMDEPFSGLDSIMIDKTTALLARIAQANELQTIIIVSHDLPNSVAISDTCYILSRQGRENNEGATIVKEIDLIERNLAWRPDIKDNHIFYETLKEIKSYL